MTDAVAARSETPKENLWPRRYRDLGATAGLFCLLERFGVIPPHLPDPVVALFGWWPW